MNSLGTLIRGIAERLTTESQVSRVSMSEKKRQKQLVQSYLNSFEPRQEKFT